MGRNPKYQPERLTPASGLTAAQRAQLEQERETLRARVALLNQRGKLDTAHHTMLARVEAAVRAWLASDPDEAPASPFARPDGPPERGAAVSQPPPPQEDTDHGAP